MIVGLIGYAQSGKDTVANVLIDKYGFERKAFADKIRDIVYDMNPIVATVSNEALNLQYVVDRDGWDVAKQTSTVRRYLQNVGVAARKHLGTNVWVTAVMQELDPEKRYVISDVRFQNEANMITAMGGELWRVERPGVGPVNDHVSELELANFSADRTLLNSGTLEELEMLVRLRLDSYLAYQTH